MLSNEYSKKVSQSTQNEIGGKRLKLVKTFVVSKKHRKQKEYWFSDRSNNLVNIDIDTSNPLISLMDMVVNKNDITINGRFKKCTRDGNEFIKVNNKFTFV
jgi:uncharacterized protein YdeI (BOF family)